MGLIFDLDQTLIDTSIASIHRKNNNWNSVYNLIPQFNVYDGVYDVIDFVITNKIPYCIVTSSPSIYTNKILNYWKINCNNLVCYHDTKLHKPNPEPFILAKKKFFLNSKQIISFGDRLIDIQCANSSNVKAVACLWGSDEKELFNISNCYKIINSPNEIVNVIKDNINNL